MKLFLHFYDFYPYGGFYRCVKLIFDNRRLLVRTRDYKVGEIEVEVTGNEVEKVGGGGQRTLVFDSTNEVTAVFKDNRATVRVPNFRLWSPGTPNLHIVTIKSDHHSPTPTLNSNSIPSARFGIRTVEAHDKKLWLNGQELFLKGVNRHEQCEAFVSCWIRHLHLAMSRPTAEPGVKMFYCRKTVVVFFDSWRKMSVRI